MTSHLWADCPHARVYNYLCLCTYYIHASRYTESPLIKSAKIIFSLSKSRPILLSMFATHLPVNARTGSYTCLRHVLTLSLRGLQAEHNAPTASPTIAFPLISNNFLFNSGRNCVGRLVREIDHWWWCIEFIHSFNGWIISLPSKSITVA